MPMCSHMTVYVQAAAAGVLWRMGASAYVHVRTHVGTRFLCVHLHALRRHAPPARVKTCIISRGTFWAGPLPDCLLPSQHLRTCPRCHRRSRAGG